MNDDSARAERIAANTEEVLRVLQRQIQEDYAPPRVKRDAHPKMHGCVQAELTVEHDVPGPLRHGVFARPGATFKAWVRFSNAFGIQHDLLLQPRGMAIKLLEVDGPRLESDEQRTQDFLLATHDAFFLPAGDDTRPSPTRYTYAEFARALGADPPQALAFFKRHGLWCGLYQMARSAAVLARSPLAIPYFSQTPYRLGPQAQVKLQARPRLSDDLARSLPAAWWFWCETLVANFTLLRNQRRALRPAAEQWCDQYLDSRDLLRRSMMDFLGHHEAEFDLMVQVRKESPRMPIDDATRRWPQRLSPFEKVATIRIPPQVFWPTIGLPDDTSKATTDMMDLGENMSFNPWHSLEAHEPLGTINQMRRRIYPGIAGRRRELNGVAAVKPAAEYDRLKPLVRR